MIQGKLSAGQQTARVIVPTYEWQTRYGQDFDLAIRHNEVDFLLCRVTRGALPDPRVTPSTPRGLPSYFSVTADFDLSTDRIILELEFRPIPDRDYDIWISPYGQYRNRTQAYQGHPASAASVAGPGGPTAQQIAQQQASAAAQQNAYSSRLGALGAPQQLIQQAYEALLAQQLLQTPLLLVEKKKKKPLPVETIFGEILAYRVWRLTAHYELQSGYTDVVWSPNVPMSGDVDKGHGVHAFKTQGVELHNAASEYKSPHGVAIGTVELWGEVIEGDLGYRAQYARVVEIISVTRVPILQNRRILTAIRQTYCPPQDSDQNPDQRPIL